MPPPSQRHHPALLDLADARALLDAVDHLAGAGEMILLASRFLALTAVRLACVRGATWEEIEDLDGSEPLWRVPAARMKMKAAKKSDPANDHLVPLSSAAVTVLRAARAACVSAAIHEKPCVTQDRIGDTQAIFPAISEGAIGALYDRAGYAGRHVPHGWRASFSTIMNERQPADRAIIDRALAHTPAKEDMSKVEAAYNRAARLGAQLDDRRRVFQAWADALMG